MKKIFFLTILSAFFLVFFVGKLSAQVTIGADVAPKPFSVLELMGQYETGVYGGLRLPQLTTAERDAISGLSAPEAKGLTIFNTTTNCMEYWNGTEWKSLCDSGTGGGGTGPGGGTTGDPGTWNGIECKAKISATEWKKFMCRNLGAAPNADPITPSDDLNGDYYQWGSKTPIATLTEIFNTDYPWTAPGGWYGDKNPAATDAKEKSFYDPCPAGYRVPTYVEWQGVLNNNTWTWISAGANSGYMVGNFLFLPAAGYRSGSNGTLVSRGTYGFYWSSRVDNAMDAYRLYFRSAGAGMNYDYRANGTSVRCIAE